MKIAQFNFSDTKGGAAKAALRLHNGLLDLNLDSTFYVRDKETNLDTVRVVNQYSKSVDSELLNLVDKNYIKPNRSDISNTLFTASFYSSEIGNIIDDYDVINLHWVEKLLSNNNLYNLTSSGKNLVWTLHDMKPFTGGCHYSSNCINFENTCSDCPQLMFDSKNLTRNILREKINIFKDSNIKIITPSSWLADQAKKSSVFKEKEIVVIPNSINIDIFNRKDKCELKKELDIDPNCIVLYFSCLNHNEKRKGMKLLIEVFETALKEVNFKKLCEDKKIVFLTTGKPSKELENLPINIINYDYIQDDEMLAKLYNAADITLLPSIEDNLPNILLESYACETPIIGFDTGGIKDIVEDNKSGFLVKNYNSKYFSDVLIDLILDSKKRKAFGRQGYEKITNFYTPAKQASSYLKLYESFEKTNKLKTPVSFKKINSNILSEVVLESVDIEVKQNPDFISEEFRKKVKKHDFLIELTNRINIFKSLSFIRNPFKYLTAILKIFWTLGKLIKNPIAED